jgi:hypothetical protein
MRKQKPKNKRTCKGEADAILQNGRRKVYMKSKRKQKEGYKEVVAAAGGDPTKAFQLLLIENYQNWLKHKRQLKISKLIKSPYGIQVTMATTEQDRLLILFLE